MDAENKRLFDRAMERAAAIMSGAVTYSGYERELARALIALWQGQGELKVKVHCPMCPNCGFVFGATDGPVESRK